MITLLNQKGIQCVKITKNKVDNEINSIFSLLPYEIKIYILTKLTTYCVVRNGLLKFINPINPDFLLTMNYKISRIPKSNYKLFHSNEACSAIKLNLCHRYLEPSDLIHHEIKNCVEMNLLNVDKAIIYIHKMYTIVSETALLKKHTKRLCILYFYIEGIEYPYSRTFSLPVYMLGE